MSRPDRIMRIHKMLELNRSVGIAEFLDELEISRATFKRDVEFMRDRLNAPIVWDREANGYRYQTGEGEDPAYSLPGFWLSASEIRALLAAQQILAEIEPGLLAASLAPIRKRLTAILGDSAGHDGPELARRVKLIALGRRKVEPRHFSDVAAALLERRRINVRAFNRERAEDVDRCVSPQRLVHYRDNWYLDGWCHLRKALRTFALENIKQVELLDGEAKEMADKELDDYFSSAYGIFAGKPRDRAVLRFSPERARWVSGERWHSDQSSETLKDGSYRLTIPYNDPRELIMDILRHGSHVEVQAPKALRELVAAEADRISTLYRTA